PREHTARALTIAFSGAGGALVLGVPVAAWIGAHVGWRAAFGVVGVLAAVVAVLILLLVEPVRSPVVVTGRMMLAAARTRGVRYGLALTGLVVVGQFITYSFVSPVLHNRAGVELGDIGLMLLMYGIAGLIGNFAVAPLLRRSPPLGVVIVVIGTALSLVAVLLVMTDPTPTMLVMPMWGLFVGAISVAMQAFIGSEASEVLEEGTALNSAAFNTSIALGALIGGVILDAAGQPPLILTSVVMVGGGALPAHGREARPGHPVIRNDSSPRGVSRRTSMPSTRALAGPRRRCAIIASTASGGPSTSASTVPSSRFRTVPPTPQRAAAEAASIRKPTPCTRPVTRTILRTLPAASAVLSSMSSPSRRVPQRRPVGRGRRGLALALARRGVPMP